MSKGRVDSFYMCLCTLLANMKGVFCLFFICLIASLNFLFVCLFVFHLGYETSATRSLKSARLLRFDEADVVRNSRKHDLTPNSKEDILPNSKRLETGKQLLDFI